jgi:hypothetical protein
MGSSNLRASDMNAMDSWASEYFERGLTEQLSVTGVRGNGAYVRRQRLYRPDEISAAMNRSGLEIRGLFADAMGAAFEPAASSTMWVIGERVCH